MSLGAMGALLGHEQILADGGAAVQVGLGAGARRCRPVLTILE
jgi:hypothetical protein